MAENQTPVQVEQDPNKKSLASTASKPSNKRGKNRRNANVGKDLAVGKAASDKVVTKSKAPVSEEAENTKNPVNFQETSDPAQAPTVTAADTDAEHLASPNPLDTVANPEKADDDEKAQDSVALDGSPEELFADAKRLVEEHVDATGVESQVAQLLVTAGAALEIPEFEEVRTYLTNDAVMLRALWHGPAVFKDVLGNPVVGLSRAYRLVEHKLAGQVIGSDSAIPGVQPGQSFPQGGGQVS